ncbi:mitochondrial carrier domain-containing protein [Fimicolochytrium jonesii]|uniref:mitochondrial carrier domain-containing protein n=1 Tax=Fimicolochytrium jonesii TaxID=1396493 RepID=UPI0022FE1B01|nr:mitochondrial carrier domain-containing protein [Fimicolochytrium jonesii]KAI8816697.1 mitochondrial carrier domain-containing protein [Fimicolochytrium jonesii]
MTLTEQQPRPNRRPAAASPVTLPPLLSVANKPEKTFTGSAATDQALAGFTAGAVSTVLLHPLDLVKTRFQLNTSRTRLSSVEAIKKIWREEGKLRGLYRGVSPNFAGATVSWGMYFWWYSLIKDWMRDSPTHTLGPTQHLLASAEAGALTAICSNPFWVIKTRMCATRASDPGAYRSLANGLCRTWREEGLRGLYKGMVPAFFGVSHGALQFMAYEEMKKWRMDAMHGKKDVNKLNTLEYITMAASSKVFATVCTYPYQVLRSRLQVQVGYSDVVYNGVIGTIKTIYRNESFAGFYKGMGINIIRVLPGTCVTFGVYEGMSKFFRVYGA